MMTIQELGLSIMSDNPKPFYVVGGIEYGIKDKYLDTLAAHWGRKEEYPTITDLISLLGVKHLIPLLPAVYVVRYDTTFVSSISPELVHQIKSLKFKGTIFCIYEDPKNVAKIDKYMPDATCSIDAVNPTFIEKYLHSDFPHLDDRSIRVATKCSTSYGHARTICKSMDNADPSVLARMTEGQLMKLFGCDSSSEESEIQKAIAARNFPTASALLDKYEGNTDNLVYLILQTMIELEKVLTSKYVSSNLNDYAKFWKIEDVYNMFMNSYEELQKLRSNTSTDARMSLLYLFGLFTFKDIPSVEVMKTW